ncbi:MAG: hypothetical protein ACFE0Q_16515 [Anaerolineae bacterium]
MSEQEREIAIARLKARGCRRWVTLILIAPVFLCAALTLLAPTIRDYLARSEANRQCQTMTTTQVAGFSAPPIRTDNHNDTPIRAEALEQLRLLDTSYPFPDERPSAPFAHPEGHYALYPANARQWFVCTPDGEALGSIATQSDAHAIRFHPDGTLFALSDEGAGGVVLFDGVVIERLHTLAVGEDEPIIALAFHPLQDWVLIATDQQLRTYDTVNGRLLAETPFTLDIDAELRFTADGTGLIISEPNTELSALWGVRP